MLFLLVTSGNPFGFVLLRKEEEPQGMVLFLWALYCRPGEGCNRETAILDAIRKLANEIGARRLKMWSTRKGWGRRGWKEVSRVYEMDV